MIKKVWSDPVWSSVIAAAIIASASYFAGFWPHIWQFIKAIPSLLARPVVIPVWALLVAIPALVFIVPLVRSLRTNRGPQFLGYVKDRILDIDWHWRWSAPHIYNSHYQIQDLTPRCPDCKAVLEINDYRGELVICVNENCSWQWKRQFRHGSRIGHSSELDSKVRNEIDRRIYSGEVADG